MSDGQVLQAFETHQQARGLADATRKRRRSSLRRLAAFLAPLTLLAATPDLIEDWLSGYRRAETKHAYLADARAFYKWAAKRDLVFPDPTAVLEPVRRATPLPRPVSEDDLATAMWVADAKRRLVITLGAFAGLRRFEIAGLRAEDVNERRIVVREGKGRKDRVIPTHPAVWLAFKGHGIETGWLFPNGNGGHVKADTVGEWINGLFHELGIRSTLHKTRHRFGTRLAEVTNGNMLAVKEALGHANMNSAQHYVAFDTSGMAELVNRLPDIAGRSANVCIHACAGSPACAEQCDCATGPSS